MARLTNKQRRFIDEYFKTNLNATEAAIRVYATTNRDTAASIGSENLRKPKIHEEIERRINEHAMSANEVLYRLAQQARANIGDFIDPETGEVDLKKAKEAGLMHLVKRVTRRDTKYGEHVSIELYDAQSAQQLLGRYHSLFTEKMEHRWDEEQLSKIDHMKSLFQGMRQREQGALMNGHRDDD